MRKLLVITGGTKGIGRAVIEKFVAYGFDIATCARKMPELEMLRDSLTEKADIHIFKADVSDRQQVKAFCDFVNGLNRPVDVLVNNAGYFVPGDISTEQEGALEAMMEANLYSAYHVTRGFVPGMKDNKSGHIFNICSIASIKAYANGGSYAITKFALLGMSKCLREELKEFGIRVTAVMPGATLTASWEGVDLPNDRFMKVEDVADLVYAAYALSNRSVVEEVIIRPQLGDI
ncbi:MAG: SDR family oxidoreductase [Cyclobacteriaceae bacterium]|nr:SDR family oxidoreductase [Cyclobacteriaceae bacterium]